MGWNPPYGSTLPFSYHLAPICFASYCPTPLSFFSTPDHRPPPWLLASAFTVQDDGLPCQPAAADGVVGTWSRVHAKAWGHVAGQHGARRHRFLCDIRPGWAGATAVLLPHATTAVVHVVAHSPPHGAASMSSPAPCAATAVGTPPSMRHMTFPWMSPSAQLIGPCLRCSVSCARKTTVSPMSASTSSCGPPCSRR
jgi:hypothetical protein